MNVRDDDDDDEPDEGPASSAHDDGRADATGKRPLDAWVLYKEAEDTTEYTNWLNLLAIKPYRRGLTGISVRARAGPKGWELVGDLSCSDEHGNPVERAHQVAVFDAREWASQAFELAQLDHRRHARRQFRLYLHHEGRGPGRGEFATIVLGETEHREKPPADPADRRADPAILYQLLADQRGYVRELMDAQIQMAQAASAVVTKGIELIEQATSRRHDVAADVSQLLGTSPPEERTKRLEIVTEKLAGPLSVFAYQMARNMGSGAAHSSTAPSPSQEAVRRVFDSMNAEQKDLLREQLGDDKFRIVVELVTGPPDQWVANAEGLRALLIPHFGALQRILTAEQLAELLAASTV